MKVTFKGFGFNPMTFVLILLVSILLAGAFTIVKPIVVPGNDSTAAAAVYPCRPHEWRYRWISNIHQGLSWTVVVNAQIKYNGCDVAVVSGSQSCSHWAIGYAISYNWCGNYRLYTHTAYGQILVVGARYQVGVLIPNSPMSVSVHMCQHYNRNGTLLWTGNGVFGQSC